LAAVAMMLLAAPRIGVSGVISVRDQGAGYDYLTGEPIALPAGELSTNRFGEGVQVMIDRPHCARPAMFEPDGRLKLKRDGDEASPAVSGRFPGYLQDQPYVWFKQDVRHYTNYVCQVTVDRPATFYLLIDNRVNEFGTEKSYSDPVFGPPDTEWVLQDGWKRVSTGLTPVLTATNRGDYVGIDEGCNGTLNQVYAVYGRTLRGPGTVELKTQFEANIYCLVISTNLMDEVKTAVSIKEQ
jgi:hypothetical protein